MCKSKKCNSTSSYLDLHKKTNNCYFSFSDVYKMTDYERGHGIIEGSKEVTS